MTSSYRVVAISWWLLVGGIVCIAYGFVDALGNYGVGGVEGLNGCFPPNPLLGCAISAWTFYGRVFFVGLVLLVASACGLFYAMRGTSIQGRNNGKALGLDASIVGNAKVAVVIVLGLLVLVLGLYLLHDYYAVVFPSCDPVTCTAREGWWFSYLVILAGLLLFFAGAYHMGRNNASSVSVTPPYQGQRTEPPSNWEATGPPVRNAVRVG